MNKTQTVDRPPLVPTDSFLTWAVTDLAHRPLIGQKPCPDCLALTDEAITTARVTGSVGARFERGGVGGSHAVTVSRVYGTVTLAR